METKHTPGDIGTVERDQAKRLIGDYALGCLEAEGLVVVTEEQARQAGAAPDLLGALERALGDVDTMEAAISEDVSSYDAEGLLNTFGHMRRSLTAAIAKARGEEENE